MKETKIEKDGSGKTLLIIRSFDASSEKVWKAWTEAEFLDKWWAPKPYHTETKIMNFKVGGMRLYAMVSPEGNKDWCKTKYTAIDTGVSFKSEDGFCDEDGNMNPDFPLMYWFNRFTETGNTTTVTIELSFDSAEDLEKIVGMGFKEGFTMAVGNLDELLA